MAVRNTGTYAPQPAQPGLGVRNVQERLRLLFGPAATFAIGPDMEVSRAQSGLFLELMSL